MYSYYDPSVSYRNGEIVCFGDGVYQCHLPKNMESIVGGNPEEDPSVWVPYPLKGKVNDYLSFGEHQYKSFLRLGFGGWEVTIDQGHSSVVLTLDQLTRMCKRLNYYADREIDPEAIMEEIKLGNNG